MDDLQETAYCGFLRDYTRKAMFSYILEKVFKTWNSLRRKSSSGLNLLELEERLWRAPPAKKRFWKQKKTVMT
jgi:hypothetical protein